uniref:Uncharacterized protein n=1 Tax=Romanomermis culicivorax TaxID=13658 RepID=A0A915J9I1_ROMCU
MENIQEKLEALYNSAESPAANLASLKSGLSSSSSKSTDSFSIVASRGSRVCCRYNRCIGVRICVFEINRFDIFGDEWFAMSITCNLASLQTEFKAFSFVSIQLPRVIYKCELDTYNSGDE